MTRINGRFLKFGNMEYGFKILDDYDKTKDLMIDPELEYSTYLGGYNNDIGYGVANDPTGNSYITGRTQSNDFPTTPGAYDTSINGIPDAFVIKLNHTGSTIIYSTFIGGGHWDYAYDIAVDTDGNAFVTGTTRSMDFPTSTNAYDTSGSFGWDVFIFKLNSTGSDLLYSTYIL